MRNKVIKSWLTWYKIKSYPMKIFIMLYVDSEYAQNFAKECYIPIDF